MKIGPMRMPIANAPPLSPQVTPAEVEWWKQFRGPIVLRYVLQMGLPMSIVFIASRLLSPNVTNLGLAFTVVFSSLLGILASLIQFKGTEKALREQEVRWKRIRDDLHSETTDSTGGQAQ